MDAEDRRFISLWRLRVTDAADERTQEMLIEFADECLYRMQDSPSLRADGQFTTGIQSVLSLADINGTDAVSWARAHIYNRFDSSARDSSRLSFVPEEGSPVPETRPLWSGVDLAEGPSYTAIRLQGGGGNGGGACPEG